MKINRKFKPSPKSSPVNVNDIIEDLTACQNYAYSISMAFTDSMFIEETLFQDETLKKVIELLFTNLRTSKYELFHDRYHPLSDRLGRLMMPVSDNTKWLIEQFKNEGAMATGDTMPSQLFLMKAYEDIIDIVEFGAGLLDKCVRVTELNDKEGHTTIHTHKLPLMEVDGKALLVESPTIGRLMTLYSMENKDFVKATTSKFEASTESHKEERPKLDASTEGVSNLIRKFMSTIYGTDIDVKPLIDDSKKLISLAKNIASNFKGAQICEKKLGKNREMNKLMTNIKHGIHVSDNKMGVTTASTFQEVMVELYDNLALNMEYTTSTLKSEGTMFKSTKLTAKQANLIKSYDYFVTLVNYGMNLLTWCVELSAESAVEGSVVIFGLNLDTTEKAQMLSDSIPNATLFSVYGAIPSNYKSSIKDLSNEVIEADTTEERNGMLITENTDLNPLLPSNYIGGFIFSIRSGSAAKKVKQMLLLQEKMVLLESRILILKQLEENGEASEKDIRDIQIFEERLLQMQREVDEFEKEIA